ncbi:permease [Acetobacter nitrogenifigens DSM 23921 = NBRC 105050]|uniref:Membrane protein n=1 Tax=Acetobacter nitrogenifigens DSM 23921 = NBRC 105050 TaxID=1120919 RepID=A0A511X7D4_9PROT|nr:DMT family transporter [Acetobacter nitrogenifigens]GBQ95510.1 permease [Acetobacter nitrogenifigens DSM 23921 = NBRC 105050]GEN58848.1 membrane protein [Acetobacter nitrogenifigens DSM 23921 = NBRC 105050]
MSALIARKTFFSPEEMALLGITVLWGATFLIVHTAMQHCGPLFFVGLRFSIAGGLSLLLFLRTMRAVTVKEIGAGALIGVSIFLGYSLQTYGLETLDGGISAFLTALYVPITPLLQWAVMKRRPKLMTWVGIGFAFTGLLCLTGPGAMSVGLGRGEIATFASACAIAAEIILIGRFASKVDSVRVTVVQLLTVGVLSFVVMPIAGESAPSFSWVWLSAAVGLGMASALIQLTMNWAQRAVSPARATIIYAGEPVWAGLVGWIAGEHLPPLAILGAAFIVAGVVASELKPRRRKTAIASL